jgi:hypothetical protein
VAARRPKFTKEVVSNGNEEDLAQHLTTLERAVHDMTQASRNNPFGQSLIVRNVECGTGGGVIRVKHGFNRRVQWLVVGFRDSTITGAAVSGPSLTEDSGSTTATILGLRTYAAGVADIMVF